MKYKWIKTVGPFAFILGLLFVTSFGTVDSLVALLILCSVIMSACAYGCVKLLELLEK